MAKLHLNNGSVLTVIGAKQEALDKVKNDMSSWAQYTDSVDSNKVYEVNKLQIAYIED